MKKCFILLLLFVPFMGNAQTISADSAAIREACLNYVQGFYNGDTARVAKAVHPELSKRIVMKRAQYKLNNMSAESLIAAAKGHKNPEDPKANEPFAAKVLIYDMDQEIATVKITTNKMKLFDYAQLAKINGEWKIINVLWAFTN